MLFTDRQAGSAAPHPLAPSFKLAGPISASLRAPQAGSFPTGKPDWEPQFGEESPLARRYDAGAAVLHLGTGFARSTALHLAEHRAVWPGKVLVQTDGAAVLVNGQRQWVSFDDEPANDDDFEEIGFAFDSICPLITGVVGAATAQWFSMVHAVDFAVDWMTQNLGLR